MTYLNGWKEIASYLGRGVRTVQRWESLGLPIRRPHGNNRSAVVALAGEIDEWCHRTPASRKDELAELRERNALLESQLRELKALLQEESPVTIRVAAKVA